MAVKKNSDDASLTRDWKSMKQRHQDANLAKQYAKLTGKKIDFTDTVVKGAEQVMAQQAALIESEKRVKSIENKEMSDLNERFQRMKKMPLPVKETKPTPPLLLRAQALDKARGDQKFSGLFLMIKKLYLETKDGPKAEERLKKFEILIHEEEKRLKFVGEALPANTSSIENNNDSIRRPK